MPIKAVIWDIGGVIMRTEDLKPRDQLAADLGVTRDYLNELIFGGKQGTRAQRGELTQKEIWDYARSELNLNSWRIPQSTRALFRRRCSGHRFSRFHPFP